jgi:hypothetical protein
MASFFRIKPENAATGSGGTKNTENRSEEPPLMRDTARTSRECASEATDYLVSDRNGGHEGSTVYASLLRDGESGRDNDATWVGRPLVIPVVKIQRAGHSPVG